MADLLNRAEHFVTSAELVNLEPTWAYLNSHKLREMSTADGDYKYLDLIAGNQPPSGVPGHPAGTQN
jgi:hypothetical protein